MAIVAGEPVGEGVDQVIEPLSGFALQKTDAAFAGFVGDDHGEALVARAGPYRRFAQTREAENRNLAGVDVGIGLEVIEGAAQSPGPCADGAPFVGLDVRLA